MKQKKEHYMNNKNHEQNKNHKNNKSNQRQEKQWEHERAKGEKTTRFSFNVWWLGSHTSPFVYVCL